MVRMRAFSKGLPPSNLFPMADTLLGMGTTIPMPTPWPRKKHIFISPDKAVSLKFLRKTALSASCHSCSTCLEGSSRYPNHRGKLGLCSQAGWSTFPQPSGGQRSLRNVRSPQMPSLPCGEEGTSLVYNEEEESAANASSFLHLPGIPVSTSLVSRSLISRQKLNACPASASSRASLQGRGLAKPCPTLTWF